MQNWKSLLKSIVPAPLRYRARLLREYRRVRALADRDLTSQALGDVTPEWRARIDDVLAAPDNASIPRLPNAGEVANGVVTMHNGIQVSALGYYGAGVLNMLVENRGVHEPQEERAFAEVLRHLPPDATMIELGAYWGFYSLWFASTVARPRCYLLEPSLTNLCSGMMNFRRAGRRAHFEHAYAGAVESAGNYDGDAPTVTVDAFCRRRKLERVTILHADTQGAEVDVLRGADGMLAGNRIDYLFLSTHTNALHEACLQRLRGHQYAILASADLDQSYALDGVIVARRSGLAEPLSVTISQKPTRPNPP